MEKNIYEEEVWKNKNQQYLFELQKFLDITDNVEKEDLRKLIIYQMLKCDRCLTKIAIKMLKKKEDNV